MSEEKIEIDELVTRLDPENVRSHDRKSQAALEESLGHFGAVRSVVMDGDGVIRAGNGTVSGAAAAGITEAVVIQGAPDELVIVQRDDLVGSEAEAYSIADNRIGELSSWDRDALGQQLAKLNSTVEIADMGFTAKQFERLSANVDLDGLDEEPDVPRGKNAGVKLVRLLYTDDTIAEFNGCVDVLSEKVGFKDASESVMAALEWKINQEDV